ncbi:MAG: VWA domain-containing protein [Anaerolineae bacterium]
MHSESKLFKNVLLFTRSLHAAGLNVTPTQTTDFLDALLLIDIRSRNQVYYAARSLLVNRREQMRLFDTIFNFFWRRHVDPRKNGVQKTPLAPRHKRPPQHQYAAMLMARAIGKTDREIEMVDKAETYSDAEMIQQKEFAAMTAEELDTVKKLIQQMKWQISKRVTRRRVPSQQGDMLNLRKGMRSAAKYGGVPAELTFSKRKIKERPIVLLADISGSMEKYSRLVLQFFYSVSQSMNQVESFVFGTRLTRITGDLKLKNIDRAVDQASREIIDWSGGTRIGESFATFNREWSRRVLRRGAIAIVVSDGWERGDSSQLIKEMRYLQHRCHRLVWLNPLSGRASYEAKVDGMSAALPYIDDFLPIHNLQSLNELATHLEKLK